METGQDVLLDFALDEGTDFWDLAAIIALLEEESEKIEFHRGFSLEAFTCGQCIDYFRFTPQQLTELCHHLRMPATITAGNPTSASGVEVLCIVLRRLAYPCRYVDLEQLFDRPRLELCFLFNAGVHYIDEQFKDRLINPIQVWLMIPRILEYCAAIQAKGSLLPRCWGFVDGTARGMCKPSRHQRMVYNSHKKFHGLKFQGVVTPNGLIANLWGPMSGRRHDSALLNGSGLLEHIETYFHTAAGEPLYLYGDAAYPRRPHLQRAHKGINVTVEQRAMNTEMSKLRQCVEWQFGKLVGLFAFLDFKKNLKLFKSPVGKLYRVGALLTNCHGCLNGGNETSEYFGLQPPTLGEYLY